MTTDADDRPETGGEASEASREQRLGWILAECSDLLNSGHELDVRKIIAQHPDLAEELYPALHSLQRISPHGRSDEPLGVLGDYRLLRELGRGGMGVVYEAWQASMDRRVALKVLPPGLAADTKVFMRFMREAKAAGRLNHQNVVSVHGMGVERDTPYYAMEFVEGETLAQILQRLRGRTGGQGSETSEEQKSAELTGGDSAADFDGEQFAAHLLQALREPEPLQGLKGFLDADGTTPAYCLHVAEAFASVAEGLQHAHSHGVIHRDLKPSNLIMDRDGRLRILDFGLAHLEGQETVTFSGEFIGTPVYVSPEQARARKVSIDHRTDIYSLGATLYEALTWRPPFRGKDYQDTLSQIIHRDPPPPRSIQPGITRDLETIVLKCLRKDPDDRYRTAEALAQDLRRFVRGDLIEARPQSGWLRWKRRLYSHRMGITLGLVLIVLAAAAAMLIQEYRTELSRLQEARYGEKVLDAVMLLGMCEMTAHAATDAETGRDSPIDPQDIFATGDFEAPAGRAGDGPLDRALEELEEARAILPDRPEAYYHRGRGLALKGQRDSACSELARALERAPGFVPARMLRQELSGGGLAVSETPARRWGDRAEGQAWCELWSKAHEAMQIRSWKQAARLYSLLVREFQEGQEPYLGLRAEAYLGRGRAYLEDNDTTGAIESFLVASTLWPHAAVPQLLLGKAYYLRNEPDHAERVFQSLFEEAGDLQNEAALWVAAIYKYLRDFRRGLEWSRKLKDEALRLRLEIDFNNLLGRFDEAIKVGRAAIQRFPKDARAHVFLAVALFQSPSTAREGLDVALRGYELDPRPIDSLGVLAAAYQRSGDVPKAKELCLQAIEMAPEEPRAYDHLGLMLWQEGRLDEAEARFREAARLIEKNPHYNFLNPHANLARISFKRGKFDEATRWFAKIAELYPKSHRSLLELGRIQRRLGRLEEAGTSLGKAIKSAPLDPDCWRELALLRVLSQDWTEATSALREAVQLQPANLQALKALVWVLERRGQFAEAFDASTSALKAGASGGPLCRSLVKLQLRELGDSTFAAPWDSLVPILEGEVGSSRPATEALQALALALAYGHERRDPDKAVELATKAVEATSRRDADALAVLGDVEFARGNTEKAVLVMESALALPLATKAHGRQLEKYRRALLPRLASYASVDWGLAPIERSSEKEGVLLSALAKEGNGPDAGSLTLYLEGRILERSGEFAEALQKLGEISKLEPPPALVVLHAGECSRRIGDFQEAERKLRKAMEEGLWKSRPVWDLWMKTCIVDLARTPAEVLREFPERRTETLPARGVQPKGSLDYGDDCRWLLQQLQAGPAVRINCGGDEYRDSSGRVWGRDRFFEGGIRFPPPDFEINGTDDDGLVRAARLFPPEMVRSGYGIPLPRGNYRITLYFAELSVGDYLPRSMDVFIEGEGALSGYDPLRAGLAVADQRSFEREVTDGLLEIVFSSQEENCLVSAIEVVRLD